MYIKLPFILFFIILNQIYSKTKLLSKDESKMAGVKIALKQDLILDFQRKYIPTLLDKIGHISIPDQQIDIDAKIGTLHIYLTGINFSITNLLSDNIFVNFNSPNLIQISAKKITGNGNLRSKFKLGFISETDTVNFDIKDLEISVETALETIESRISPGKLIPSCSITDIKININFDFDIHGSLIAAIAKLVHSKIHDLINDKIQNSLKASIQNTINNLIQENVNKLPVYIPINKFDLSVDYSLVSKPVIIDKYLILNSFGSIVNLNKPESLNIPYSLPENLPDFDKNGKLSQVFFSDFSLNTAIRTLHLTGLLKVSIDSSEIPKDSPVQFNTTSLDLLIDGFIDVYGKDKLVKFDCESYGESPEITIPENKAIGNLNAFCGIFVEVENSNSTNNNTNLSFDKAIEFNTSVTVNANAILTEGGKITVNIQSLNLKNTQFLFSKIPKGSANRFEELVNFSSRLIVPFLNKKYLNDLSVEIPSFDGIYFNDSTLEIKERFIEINLTPKVTAIKNVKALIKNKNEEDEIKYN
jgi:hypothetical protein